MDKRYQKAYGKLVDRALNQIEKRKRVERVVSLFYCNKCSEVKTLTFEIDNDALKEALIADINPVTQEAYENGCVDCGGKLEYLGHVIFTVVVAVRGNAIYRMFVVMDKEFRHEKNVRVWSMELEEDNDKINLTETQDNMLKELSGQFRDVIDESAFKREGASWWV